MKKVYRIVALLLMGAILFSCAKETFVDKDAIAGEATASITGDGSDNGDESGANEGGEAGPENGEGTTPAEKPEFIDNNDWSAYDENEYLIGFGAADENSPEDAKATIDLSDRSVAWKSDDRATVYVPATGARGTYAYDATRKQFRPASPNDIVAIGNNLAYVYYPASLFQSYSSNTATVTMPGPVAVGNVTDLGDKLPMAGIIPANQGKPYPTVTFRNLGSVLRVQLTGCETITSVTLSNTGVALAGDNAGSVTWSDETAAAVPTLAMSGDTKSVTVSCGEGGLTLNESTPTEFYFLLPSSGTMSDMKVRVNFLQNDGTYDYTPYIEKTRSSGLALASSRNKIIKLAFRAGFFSGGKGTSDAPYQISTPAQLNQLGQYCRQTDAYKGYNETAERTYFSTAHYVQTANLNCSGVSISGPIGSVTWPFYGSYDGDGYTISNYSLSTNGSYQVALFGKVLGGTIEGVRLQSASISSSNTESSTINVAGVVAYLSGGGTVDDCQSISTSVQGLKTGGVVGYVENGTVSDCQSRGVTVQSQGTYLVNAVATYGYAGGVVGGTKDGTISGCRCWGANADGTGTASSISGGGVAGGIAGYIGGASGTTTVTDVYVTNATISTTGNYAGGAIGNIYGGGSLTGRTGDGSSLTVKDANVTAANYAGGLAGRNTGSITGTKYGSENKSYTALTYGVTVNATDYAGGLCGINENAGMLDCCYANGNTVTASHAYAGGLCGTATGTQTLTDCLARGSTIKAFDGDSTYGDYVGGLFGYLGASTGLDCSEMTADNGYNNTIDGNGYVGGVCGQQLGAVTGHTSSCMCLKSTITARSEYLGGISGSCEGDITNCIVGKSDNVNALSGTNTIGGIAGIVASDATLSGCDVSYTTFSSTTGYVGGVVGCIAATAEVSHCTVTGLSLSSSGNHYGGIVGNINDSGDGTISDCTATSLSITAGGSNLGGILGYVCGTATISGCDVSSISISSSSGSSVGGIVGRVGESSSKTGTLSVSSCNASGTITATSAQAVGGIVGLAWNKEVLTVTDCINTASVSGKEFVGGIVGRMTGGIVEECRSRASVTASLQNAGGIAGLMNGGTIATCYASGGTVTGAYVVGGLVGKMYSSESRTVVVNSAARMNVTSTSNAGASVYNCASGGIVGTMQSVYSSSYNACVYNCVAFDCLVKNTSADNVHCLGGVVGFVTGESVDVKTNHLSIIRNCYAQTVNNNLKYKYGGTEIQCPSDNYCGGIFGRLYRGRVYDCYYRCTQSGEITSAQLSYDVNYTQITTEAKNGTANIDVALTLASGRKVSADTQKLWEVLTLGSYSGDSGTSALNLGISKGGSIPLSTWTYYTSSSNSFAVPKVLKDKGENWYKN